MVKGLPVVWGTCSRTVVLDQRPLALTCWKDTIVVGLLSGKIITLDRVTGIQTAVLSGHTAYVRALAFLTGQTLLVSGSYDKTVKLWDLQTGAIVKTFYGHMDGVVAVSISADCTMIASGSCDKSIRLWDIQTEECHCVIEQQHDVYHVRFSPTDPQCLISVSGGKVYHWDINGHQTNPAHNGSYIAFSLDGTQLISCHKKNIVVHNPSSGGIVAKFYAANSVIRNCCFSPDGRLIAAAANQTVYVWDTTSSHPHPIKTFVGHTRSITSLEFSSPSCLISSSHDNSVRFWKTGTLQTDPTMADTESASLNSAQIMSITLQTQDGIAISSNSDGVVKIWDISTGLCKASFQTVAKNPEQSDVRLINGNLIFVWYTSRKIYMWDVEEGESLWTVDVALVTFDHVNDVRISGDGSNILCLRQQSIQVLSMQTGEVVGKVELEYKPQTSLTIDGSRVWACSPLSDPLGWDFGTPGSPPVQLSNSLLLFPTNAKLWDIRQSRIEDAVTGRVVFQLAGRFLNPVKSQWDGHYLVAGYRTGEVLILDFKDMHF